MRDKDFEGLKLREQRREQSMTPQEKRLAEGLAMARCTQANLENLSKAVPGLSGVPMFKIVQLQISQTIKALTGQIDD